MYPNTNIPVRFFGEAIANNAAVGPINIFLRASASSADRSTISTTNTNAMTNVTLLPNDSAVRQEDIL